jgi:hypothetical protein
LHGVLGRNKLILNNNSMLRVAAVSTRDRQVCAGTMYFGGVLGRDTHLAKAGMYGASLKYCCSLLLLFVLQMCSLEE